MIKVTNSLIYLYFLNIKKKETNEHNLLFSISRHCFNIYIKSGIGPAKCVSHMNGSIKWNFSVHIRKKNRKF